MECPLPIPSTQMQLGELIVGAKKDRNMTVQRVAMSHDGRKVVLASPFSHYFPEGSTTVNVFDFNGTTWEGAGIFSGRLGDRYGMTISLSGNGKRLAIAAWGTGGVDRVEMYENIMGNTWIPVAGGQILTGETPNELFASSISLSDDGTRIAIASTLADVNGEESGSVYVYELQGNTEIQGKALIQLGETIYGEAPGDQFGTAVTMSGDGSTLAIGAPWSDENGEGSGSVRVFRYSSKRRTMQETQAQRNDQSMQHKGEWLQVGQKLLGAASGDFFGWSLSINYKGNTLAIGTYGDNMDYAQVFNLDNNLWYQLGKTLYGPLYFGYSVFLAPSTHRLAVGPYDSHAGYVEIYDFNQTDWVLVQRIATPPSEKYFGSSVSLSACGNQIAIGSSNDTHGLMTVYEFD